MNARWSIVWALVSVGCATSQKSIPPPQTPAPTSRSPTEEAGEPLPGQAAAIPPPPAECNAFRERTPAALGPCTDPSISRSLLADALTDSDSGSRDAKLLGLERCSGLPPGSIRALRAELGPVACGDAIVEPLLEHPPSGVPPLVRDALSGLGLAARASRLVQHPPKLAPPHDKDRVQEFVQGPLKKWIEGQAHAIEQISLNGSNLQGYGKGVVAVEAGLADLRFVEVARQAPVPDPIKKDPELEEAYFVTLEEALDPRKQRGRDAALVGLKKLAEAGVVADPRVGRARSLLSKLFSGRRIDALDSLLLPAPKVRTESSVEEKLGRRLPTFYFGLLVPEADAREPALLQALLERGLPESERKKLESAKQLSPETRILFARGLFALGQRYWRSSDFAQASKLLESAPKKGDAALLSSLCRPLAGGPKDAAEMMLRGPLLPRGVADVASLDVLGKDKSALGGMALFDAARLLEIGTPPDADPSYWNKIAERYREASSRLVDAGERSDAQARAQGAAQTADAISAAKAKK